MANAKKESQLQSLTDLIKASSNFALIKHEKTKHIALEGLRKDLKTNESSLKIIKNSILEKAIKQIGTTNKSLKEFSSKAFPLKETTAIVSFSNDWSKGVSAFHKFSQKEQTLSFKFGVLDNTVYGADDLVKIAKLPGRAELTAKVIGSMKSPIYGFVHALKFNMQKFVYVLNAKAKQS